MDLRNKHIIVTGAASGIGAETAEELKRESATVIGVDLNQPQTDIDHFVKVDLADPASIESAVSDLPDGIDAICNIAGLPPTKDRVLVIKVNFLGLRHFTELMIGKLNNNASIVNMASLAGQCFVVSEGRSVSIILKYGDVNYPGEYFAYNGTDVEVATISPGQRSPLGDFLFRYKGLIKEGLLGGVWSLGWPLLDMEKKNPSLKYTNAKVDGRELHEINYTPKGGLNGIKVKLFFEPGTFHHVRTEYRLRVEGEQALQAGQTVTAGVPNSRNLTTGQPGGPITRDAGIMDLIEYSHYLLVEKFDSFKKVKIKDTTGRETMSLVLPQSYDLEYSVEGQGSTFLGRWNLIADQWMQNGTLNSAIFKVP